MATEPERKRVIAFFDGQNLFHCAKREFGHPHPNYDPRALSEHVVRRYPDWDLGEIRFYTGIHDASVSPHWNHYWSAKLAVMGTRGITTFSRTLRYHNQPVPLPDGSRASVRIGQEKGSTSGSLDQVTCAFPQGAAKCRGVNGTQWIPIERTTYDQCLDPIDYRSK